MSVDIELFGADKRFLKLEDNTWHHNFKS
jgi:hypothetical protein